MKTTFHIISLLVTLCLFFFVFGCGDDSSSGSASDPVDDDDDDDNDDNDDDDSGVDYTPYVNPFIGTAGDRGQLHPAASTPFGMVKLGPDTLLLGHSGYNYNSKRTIGFSHTRIGGVGCSGAGGNLRVLPSTDYNSFFAKVMDKTTEHAGPGYYDVVLQDSSPIQVELTASQHVGYHRYTFSDNAQTGYFRISVDQPFSRDLGHSISVNNGRIEGWVSATTVCNYGQYKFYFAMDLDRNFQVLKAEGTSQITLAVDLEKEKSIQMKVALSTISEDDAGITLENEGSGWDFENKQSLVREKWNDLLGKIEVTGEEEYKELFYTFLYRSAMVPVSVSGDSGQYRGVDDQVHQVDGAAHYHCWSLWDTYRTKYPLLSLITGSRYRDIMRSLVELFMQGKQPWAGNAEPFPTVRTEHGVALLLDALEKGTLDFGIEDAYDDILAEAESFAPDSPDTVLETAYDYWAVALIAQELGHTGDYQAYLALSRDYEDEWIQNFLTMGQDADEVHARGLYEGTLWQYRWAVVHDIYNIVDIMGGRESFLSQLNQFFDEQLYNQGNEPDIHAPFLFNYVGAPLRTQEIVRDILIHPMNQWYGTHNKWPIPYYGRIFRPEPKGYIPEMDDDVGTMAAWFALGSIGLYQVTVGQPVYVLTAPIFEQVRIHSTNHFGEETIFEIHAENLSESNIYIQEAYLNDEPLPRTWLYHDEIASGGDLRLVMGSVPSSFGASESNAPPDPMDLGL